LPSLIEDVKKFGVEWLELHFTDLFGRLKMTMVPANSIDGDSLRDGIPKLDGSSVSGFGKIEYSDLNLLPDEDTFVVLPWKVNDETVARVYCYVYKSFGAGPLEVDPRQTTNKLVAFLKKQGFKAYTGLEAEYYVLKEIKVDVSRPYAGTSYYLGSPEAPWSNYGYPTMFKDGYYTALHTDTIYEYRYKVASLLKNVFGVGSTAHHHEVGVVAQMEIDIKHSDPLRTADNYMTLKYVARKVAQEHGLYVTFMPKPIYGDNGSGLHTHISLWRGDENIFYDADDEYAELSQEARYFIGGLLEHGRSLSAIVSPTVNSYKRLVPGYEAPIYLAWSRGNRSSAVRVPVYRRGRPWEKRIEYRPPDPLANPYLALAAIIMAGLDGIKKKIDPGDPVDKDIYHMSDSELRQYNIRSLPRDLYEALEELKSDNEYLKPVFSSSLIDTYIDIKLKEFLELNQYPSPIEVHRYFSF